MALVWCSPGVIVKCSKLFSLIMKLELVKYETDGLNEGWQPD
jgi:hypothetical protein